MTNNFFSSIKAKQKGKRNTRVVVAVVDFTIEKDIKKVIKITKYDYFFYFSINIFIKQNRNFKYNAPTYKCVSY